VARSRSARQGDAEEGTSNQSQLAVVARSEDAHLSSDKAHVYRSHTELVMLVRQWTGKYPTSLVRKALTKVIPRVARAKHDETPEEYLIRLATHDESYIDTFITRPATKFYGVKETKPTLVSQACDWLVAYIELAELHSVPVARRIYAATNLSPWAAAKAIFSEKTFYLYVFRARKKFLTEETEDDYTHLLQAIDLISDEASISKVRYSDRAPDHRRTGSTPPRGGGTGQLGPGSQSPSQSWP
jgi:hypothetical protein